MRFIAIPIILSIAFPSHLLAIEGRNFPGSSATASAAAPRPTGSSPLRPTMPGISAGPKLGSYGATVPAQSAGSWGAAPSRVAGGAASASAGAETNALIAGAILDKKDIGPICMEHARSTGLKGIGAFSNLGQKETEILTEKLFDSRTEGSGEKVEGLETETPPPLVGKHDCNGGYQLKACYGLLQKSLSNRHQANFDNGFDPNLYLEWLKLEKRIDAFGNGLKNLAVDSEVNPLKIQEEMPELSPIQRDELMLDLTMEITAAIDYQAAHGNEAKVGELASFLAQVNPSAAKAVECILRDMDYSKSLAARDEDSRKIVGPLTGTVYSSFDKNSLVGIAPLVVIGVIRVAIMVGTRIAARSAIKAGVAIAAADPTTKAAVIGAAAGAVALVHKNHQNEIDRQEKEKDRIHDAEQNEKDREIENRKAEIEREKLEFEKQKEETRIKEKNEEGNRPGTVTKAEDEKSEEQKEEEERLKALKEKNEKRLIDPLVRLREEEKKRKRDHDLLLLSSQYHFAQGDNFTSLCDGVFESEMKLVNEKIKKDLTTTRSQEEAYRLQEKQRDIIDYRVNQDWNNPSEKQAEQCSQMLFIERN